MTGIVFTIVPGLVLLGSLCCVAAQQSPVRVGQQSRFTGTRGAITYTNPASGASDPYSTPFVAMVSLGETEVALADAQGKQLAYYDSLAGNQTRTPVALPSAPTELLLLTKGAACLPSILVSLKGGDLVLVCVTSGKTNPVKYETPCEGGQDGKCVASKMLQLPSHFAKGPLIAILSAPFQASSSPTPFDLRVLDFSDGAGPTWLCAGKSLRMPVSWRGLTACSACS